MLAFLGGVVGRKHLKRVSEARRQQARENLSELKATLVGAGLPQISDDEVRSVATSTLLLTGEHSPMFSLRLTDRVEELLPRATRVEIPDASHFAHEDNPRAVNEAILTFLARYDADGTVSVRHRRGAADGAVEHPGQLAPQ